MGASILYTCVGKLGAISCRSGVPRSGRRTFRALSWVFGFLLPMRFLRERMASLGATVLDLMMSEISRLSAISSLRMR